MVLHLLPDSDYLSPMVLIEQAEIRLLPADQKPRPPLMREWTAENDSQIITHVATGCQFRAYPVPTPLVNGIRTPFGSTYEIAVRFVGTKNLAPLPAIDDVLELGRQGIEWIRTFTFESRQR